MSLTTIADVRARCRCDIGGCWHWLGAITSRGPSMWAIDYAKNTKTTMHGARAVWQIAHNQAPLPGYLIFRRCGVFDCVNPVHLAEAKDKAAIGLHMSRLGKRKGTQLEQRRANAVKARAALGIVDTPVETVHAIRAADPAISHAALGRMMGLDAHIVGDIRNGRRRAGVERLAA